MTLMTETTLQSCFFSYLRYFTTDTCYIAEKNVPLKLDQLEGATLRHTGGGLLRDKLIIQWRAPYPEQINIIEQPLLVQFNFTVSVNGEYTWINKYAGTAMVI